MDYTKVPTKFGPIYVKPSSTEDVHITLTAQDAQTEADSYITLRGITYCGSIHLRRWADGSWHYGSEFSTDRHRQGELASDYERRQYIYIRRFQIGKVIMDDKVSDSVFNLLVPWLLAAALRWIEANPQALADAELEYRLGQYEKAEKEANEALTEYRNLVAKSRAAMDGLGRATEARDKLLGLTK